MRKCWRRPLFRPRESFLLEISGRHTPDDQILLFVLEIACAVRELCCAKDVKTLIRHSVGDEKMSEIVDARGALSGFFAEFAAGDVDRVGRGIALPAAWRKIPGNVRLADDDVVQRGADDGCRWG
jgi:hypothetical protein